MRTSRCGILTAILLLAVSYGFSQSQPGTPPEKVAFIYGQKIRFVVAGQGPAVILLHGLGANKETWMANIDALSTKHHVYALDQLGFGHSEKPLLDYSIATWVDFLHAFMKSQGISHATLVGNSLGGWIALDFTLRYPEMVDKLILVDSGGLAFKLPTAILNPSSLAGWRTLLQSAFYDKSRINDQFVVTVFTQHLHDNDGYTIQRTLAGLEQALPEDNRLKDVHTPTLIIWGREDELIGIELAEKFRAGIAGSKLVVLEHCGHVPELEKPAEFNGAVLDFLEK